jgi:uncharacterized protein YecT (DUF1311 family)
VATRTRPATYSWINRTLIFLLLVAFGGTYPIATASSEGDCDRARTTADILGCYRATLKVAEQQLETLHAILKRELSSEQWEALVEADSAWLTFRRANCLSAASLYRGGTMEPIVANACVVHMTNERLRDLRTTFREVVGSR